MFVKLNVMLRIIKKLTKFLHEINDSLIVKFLCLRCYFTFYLSRFASYSNKFYYIINHRKQCSKNYKSNKRNIYFE